MLYIIYFILHIVITFLLILPFLMVAYVQANKKKRIKALISPTTHYSPIPPTPISKGNINSSSLFDFACIITAYKQLDTALPLIASLLKQTHPEYVVYIVADNCETPTSVALSARIDLFSHPQVVVLQPDQALHSKVKSMQYALSNFVRRHEFVVVFDPDNLAAPDFLTVLNSYLAAGYSAVQGKRVAKNLHTRYAAADALGEIYKNYIERYVPFVLGSSATIAGSGMAVATPLFAAFLDSPQIMQPIKSNEVIPAEDKLLQNFLIESGLQIAFAPNAVLYDEKVSTGGQVRRQRTRWLYAYFENTGQSLHHIFAGLTQANIPRLIFGLLSVIPPLFLLLGINLLLCLTDLGLVFIPHLPYVIVPNVLPSFWPLGLFVAQVLCICLFAGNVIWVLYLDKAPREVWQALTGLPAFIGYQILAMTGIRKAKKDFLTTQHTQQVSIEDVLKKQ